MNFFGTLINGVLYNKEKNEVVVTKAIFPQKKCVIESTIDELPITVINPKAFKNSSVKEVVIPETVKNIFNDNFMNCKNLKSFFLSKQLEKIWGRSFAECKNLENINLEGVKKIGNAAFYGCISLEYAFLNSVYCIDAGGFNECARLQTVVIGDDCTRIDSGAFRNCKQLKTVVLSKNIDNICGIFGKIYGKLDPVRDNPFAGCDNLKYLLYHGTQNEIKEHVRDFWVDACKMNIYYYSTEPKKGTWRYDEGKIIVTHA